MRDWVAAPAVMVTGVPAIAIAGASGPVVRASRAPAPPSDFRLKPVTVPVDPTLRVDDPRSMLRTGFGGAMVDLFPFEGGKFHVSGGGRLFNRPGQGRVVEGEQLRPLQPFRNGMLRGGRRFSPAMLVGYGHIVDRGLALGIDAGAVMGRLGATPDRFGRLNRRRLESLDGRGRRTSLNEIARVTALYRF